jgi:hypothetical protein
MTTGHKSPAATIVTVISIIAQYEEIVRWHVNQKHMSRVFRRLVSRIHVWLIERPTVNYGNALDDFGRRAAICYHSLRENPRRVQGKCEYHDVANLRIRIAVRPS